MTKIDDVDGVRGVLHGHGIRRETTRGPFPPYYKGSEIMAGRNIKINTNSYDHFLKLNLKLN
jgi:hypothetical protein